MEAGRWRGFFFNLGGWKRMIGGGGDKEGGESEGGERERQGRYD
jgi:hypothetical protein